MDKKTLELYKKELKKLQEKLRDFGGWEDILEKLPKEKSMEKEQPDED